MANQFDTLPDEVILQLFNHLHGLHELRAVSLTCKRLNSIVYDVPARTVARLALVSGDEHPVEKVSRLALLTQRLSSWARLDSGRCLQLQEAMYDDMDLIVQIAMITASTGRQARQDLANARARAESRTALERSLV
jgi:hypothetical protein